MRIFKASLVPFLTLMCCCVSHTHAQHVRQWRDAQGIIHFGDELAASRQHSQPVYIQTPISTIKNDHPLANMQSSPPAQITHQRRSPPKSPQDAPSKRTKDDQSDCEKQREQLKRLSLDQRRQAEYQYEKDCIMGHYYGG